MEIVFEDQSILVLNKPSGLVVNRSQTVKVKTLQDWVAQYLKVKGLGIGGRAGIVHRLDKETSGLLLVAKNLKDFALLQAQFKARKVEKKYLALVHGRLEPREGTIKAAISRSPFARKKFGVFLGGKEAETGYLVSRFYESEKAGKFSLVELKPKTGRTHQIRVHLKYLGHPVVADAKYAGRKTFHQDQKWCPRQFLHASFLGFRHPEKEKKIHFSLPLPNDLKKALIYLK